MVFGLLKNRRHKDTQSLGDEPIPRPEQPKSSIRRPAWAQLELFRGLSKPDIEAFQRALVPASFARGDVIMRTGETGDDMFLLESGHIRLLIEGDGTKKVIERRLQAPITLGEMALITSEPRTATIIADSQVECLRLTRDSFESVVADHLSIAKILTRLVGVRLKEIGGIRKVGKYQIVGVLGKGNVADVFEAKHPELGQTVALKMLSHALVYDPQFGAQFDREAQIVASFDHPNIVRVFDFERAYGTRFTVMERLEGSQLEDYVYGGPRMEWNWIRRVLVEVGNALSYTHSAGLIHRDVKPSNIFVTDSGATKLLDFGIAVSQSNSKCENKARLGSPCYMPPEQILGHELDGRTDLYALGMTAYEMVARQVPFNEVEIRELLRKQLYVQTPDILAVVPQCPADIAEFIHRSTSKEMDHRFPNCIEAIRSLDYRQGSAPLTLGARYKVSVDCTKALEPVVESALETFRETLARHEAIKVKLTKR